MGSRARFFGCAFDGCDGAHHSRGWCEKHYKQQRRINGFNGISCTNDACNSPALSRGLCNKHYQAEKKTGKYGFKACVIESCDGMELARGYCSKHYAVSKNYNITAERFEEMLVEQNNVCAICKRGPNGRRDKLHIDHNHVTGKVRGLLCHSCNVSIGHFNDDIDMLQSAINYLEVNK